jgi:hypothetical protein
MHGLPADVDLRWLERAAVLQVAVGEYQTQVHLDGETTLCIEGDVTFNGVRCPILRAAPGMVSLVGKRIIRAEPVRPGDLNLVFDDGTALIVHDSNRTYESYSIEHPGGSIIV